MNSDWPGIDIGIIKIDQEALVTIARPTINEDQLPSPGIFPNLGIDNLQIRQDLPNLGSFVFP
jgi:hypothetical protein